MKSGLNSILGSELWRQMAPIGANVLLAVDGCRFPEVYELINDASIRLDAEKAKAVGEGFRNDIYLLRMWFNLHSDYSELWEKIVQQRYAGSWVSLQNALDCVRVIKRLSEIDVQFWEEQLQNLEAAYPYKIFVSMGAIASKIDCSICGYDIDSLDCGHRAGCLYDGEMACGIIREFSHLDHISFVMNPNDKRCVAQIEDSSEQFKLVRYMGELIRGKALAPSAFDSIVFSHRRFPNPDYRKMGRNESCFCGSGKKFKTCCIDKLFIEGEHAEIQAVPKS